MFTIKDFILDRKAVISQVKKKNKASIFSIYIYISGCRPIVFIQIVLAVFVIFRKYKEKTLIFYHRVNCIPIKISFSRIRLNFF